MEAFMRNIHHMFSLVDDPGYRAMKVQPKSTSQAVRFDEDERVDTSPNEDLAWNLRESLPVSQINAEKDEESAQMLAQVDSVVRVILHQFDSRVAQLFENIRTVYTVMEG